MRFKFCIAAIVLFMSPPAFSLGIYGGNGGGSSSNPFGSTITVSGNTVNFTLGGSTVVQITTSPGNAQLLIPNTSLSEHASIASKNFPTTGMEFGNTNLYTIIQNSATTEFWKSGGYFGITVMGSSKKDGDAYTGATIKNEINGDGITWVDNRLPDGILGHDTTGRFVDTEIGGTVNFRVGVSSVGVNTGRNTLGGTLSVGSSNSQFVVLGSTATGATTVGLGTASPATTTTPVWVKMRLCNTLGTSCTNYYMPMWKE